MDANEFEAKRQARIDRLNSAADRVESEGKALLNDADRMGEAIPFGQPILVGHYSEKSDRRYRERMHNKMTRGFEKIDAAAELRRRAEAAEKNTAIFSDDPNASEKIEAKIERLEKRQEMMKQANKLIRKNDREGLLEMGFSETAIMKLFLPDFCGRVGFPDYALANNGANIRRLKARLAEVQQKAEQELSQTEINGIRIVNDPDANRTQIYFPGKPDKATRTALKSHGFRWAPSQGCWQRHMSNGAEYWAKRIVEEMQ
jgi:hypothetical protein